jgi:hypothetical protein
MMKKILLIILACLATTFFAPRTQAQSILSIAGTEIIGMPDTVQFGDTLNNLSVWVRNDGTLPTPNLTISVNSLINGTVLGGIVGTLNLAGALLPGDSVVVPLDAFIISPQNSGNGANLVVVWPDSPGSDDGDSLEDGYYVEETATAVQEMFGQEDEDPAFVIYPNPARDQISLKFPRPVAGEVRVYDLQGRLLFRNDARNSVIDLRLLSPGTYILELNETKGTATRKRFVRI